MVMERYGQHLKSPSFSSALLDAIYRSTDEDELILYKTTTMRKNHSTRLDERSRDHNNLKRACRIEKWTEKKVSEKVMVRRKASELERLDHSDRFRKFQQKLHLQSSSPSSESSDNETNFGFSSSETESVQVTRSAAFSANRPKPVRTTALTRFEKAEKPPPPTIPMRSTSTSSVKERNPKTKDEGGGFSKSRAARFYSEFKKARKPSSPGSKLASFLNSLFMAGSAKKAKLSSQTRNNESCSYDSSESKSNQVSSCSSASSYSRSCLSKTPSSKTPSNGVRRSVRFYPTTVIVDEDSRPCGQKFVYLPEEQKSLTASKVPLLSEKVKLHLLEKKNKQDEEAAKDLFNEFQKNSDFLMRDLGEDDRDDDDAASYSSSDLFELENLAVIEIERYQEELPVFETTNLKTNQAIAKGLIL